MLTIPDHHVVLHLFGKMASRISCSFIFSEIVVKLLCYRTLDLHIAILEDRSIIIFPPILRNLSQLP